MPVLKVTESSTRLIDVEVTFPVYSKQDLDPDDGEHVMFSRWDENGSLFRVTKRDSYDSVSYELEQEKRSLSSIIRDADSTLGRGRFACTKREFEKVSQDAVMMLALAGNVSFEWPVFKPSVFLIKRRQKRLIAGQVDCRPYYAVFFGNEFVGEWWQESIAEAQAEHRAKLHKTEIVRGQFREERILLR